MNQRLAGDQAEWTEISPVPEFPASNVARLMKDPMRPQPATIHPIDDRCDPAMVAVLRSRSPAAKLATLDAMWRSAVAFVRSGVKAQHPDWSEAAVCTEAARRMAHQVGAESLG